MKDKLNGGTLLIVLVIILVVVIIIFAFSYTFRYFSNYQLIGVSCPEIYMEVGDTEVLNAYLIHKPRWTTDFTQVPGNLFFARASGIFSIDGQTAVTKAGNPGASVLIQALSVGESSITISGAATQGDTAGENYDEVVLPVVIVAPATNFLRLYRDAALKGTGEWYNSWFGNIIINIFNLYKQGLCDEWAEWTYQWVLDHNNCRIKKVEIVHYSDPQHDCVRVTMWDGTVYYLDPHRYSSDPVIPADEYEKKYGTPGYEADSYTKPDSLKPNSSPSDEATEGGP